MGHRGSEWLAWMMGWGLLVSCGGGGSAPGSTVAPPPQPYAGQVLPAFPLVQTAGRDTGAPLPGVSLEARLEDLAAFIRVAAAVQFFHPSDGVADTNWDEFLQYGAYVVASRPGSQGLAACLTELLAPMAPSVRFDGTAAEQPRAGLLAAWFRRGYRDPLETRQTYLAERRLVTLESLPQATAGPRSTQARLTIQGLAVTIPLVQAWDGQRTLPPSQGFRVPPGWSLSRQPEDPYLGITLAGKTWAVLRTFWPYFEALGLDWDRELLPLLRACAQPAPRAAALDRALRLALTRLQDNHAVMPSLVSMGPQGCLPVVLDWVEGRAVVLHSRLPEIQRGWEALKVDGVPIAEVLGALQPTSLKNERHAASAVLSAYNGLSRQNLNQVVVLELRDDGGQTRTFSLKADQPSGVLGEAFGFREFTGLPLVDWLEPGLLYANLSDATAQDFRAIHEALSQAKGVVFDLRRYPKDAGMLDLFARFRSRTLDSLPMRDLWPAAPGEVARLVDLPQSVPGKGDLRIPALVICSRYSQSFNEHMLGYAQSAGLKVMGEATSGANGNITSIFFTQLPGFAITFTGMELRQHDRSRFHGVGILPDLLVPRTVASIRKGDDEVRAAAAAWVRERLPR